MNSCNLKKERSSARTMFLFFCFPVLFSFLTSCAADDEGKSGSKDGRGFASLELRTDTTYAVTKASSNPKNEEEYQVEILQGTEVVTSFRFGEKPDELALDAGAYTAKASWGILAPAAFDSLYMESSRDFTITKDETTHIKLTPTPANAKVQVKYAADLKQSYSDYSISMSTSHTGTSSLLYKMNETRPAYFQADAKGEKLNLAMLFVASGKEYKFDKSVNIKPRDFVTLNVKLGESKPDTTKPAPAIFVDVRSYEFPGDVVTYKDVRVISNCKDWICTKDAAWLLVTTSADGLTMSAQKNTTGKVRKATIMLTAISGNYAAIASIEVTQRAAKAEGPYITPDPLSREEVKFIHSRFSITTNETSWKYIQDADSKSWLTVEQGEGEDQGNLYVTSKSMNDTKKPRKAVITLEAVTAKDSIVITQTPEIIIPATIVVKNEAGENIEKASLLAEGGIKNLTVESNDPDWKYAVPEKDTWVKAKKEGDKLTLAVDKNTLEKDRTTVIVLTASSLNGQMATCNLVVDQAGSKPGDPKITLEIVVNDKIIGEETFDWEVDKPEIADAPRISPTGFKDGESIDVTDKNARSNFVVIQAAKGIESCKLQSVFTKESFDLTKPAEASKARIVYNSISKNTLVVLYLDAFLNGLPTGPSSYKLTVSDGSKEAYISINVNVQ